MLQPGPGLADNYRLWYVRRGADVQGPFPEPLICRYLAIGRITETDEVSQDGSYWRGAQDVPELVKGMRALLAPAEAAGSEDAQWAEERSRAARRWLDDRKSPDPRASSQAQVPEQSHPERRRGSDRRQNPESVEQVAYREGRGEFESWLRSRRQRYGRVVLYLLAAVLVTLFVAMVSNPVNPVKVGLHLGSSTCDASPRKGVNWSNCVKDDALLVGADLRGAELVGASLKRANLGYADLTAANLLHADITGADLRGARLGGAVWLDGRTCMPDSVGSCK